MERVKRLAARILMDPRLLVAVVAALAVARKVAPTGMHEVPIL